MLTYENVVGNQEDWANYITNVDMRQTPFLEWLTVGDKPVNVIYNYQAEAYAPPEDNSHVDGKPWTAFKSAQEGVGQLKALVQWFDKTTSISKLTQDVTNNAALPDLLAHDITKRLKEMSRDMEAAFLDDNDGREDNKVVGYKSRALGSWINNSAQALYPVPTPFLTPTSNIDATASGSLTEDIVRNILEGIGRTSGNKEPITLFCGPKLKRKFADFQFYVPNQAATGTSGVVARMVDNKADDRSVTLAVDQYHGDYGPVDIMIDWFLVALTGTTVVQNFRGYFVHRPMWELRWNQKPKVYRPEFKGGSYEAAMDAILMLVCKNPAAEGKYAPTT
jgi:hypothetical protein